MTGPLLNLNHILFRLFLDILFKVINIQHYDKYRKLGPVQIIRTQYGLLLTFDIAHDNVQKETGPHHVLMLVYHFQLRKLQGKCGNCLIQNYSVPILQLVCLYLCENVAAGPAF